MPREVQTVKKDPFAISPPCEQLTDLQIARNVHAIRTGPFMVSNIVTEYCRPISPESKAN